MKSGAGAGGLLNIDFTVFIDIGVVFVYYLQ